MMASATVMLSVSLGASNQKRCLRQHDTDFQVSLALVYCKKGITQLMLYKNPYRSLAMS